MSWLDDTYRILRDAAGLLGETAAITEDCVLRYFEFLKLWVKRFFLVAGVGALILIFSWAIGLRINWLLSLYTIVLGVGGCALYVLLLPISFATETAVNAFPRFRRLVLLHVERIADILFVTIVAAIYFSIAPISQNPSILPFAVMIGIAVLAGGVARRICFDRNHRAVKIARTVQIGVLFVFGMASFLFPQIVRGLANVRMLLDDKWSNPLAPHPYTVDDPSNIPFSNEIDGTPRLWYFVSSDGHYDLFDRPGYREGVPLKPVATPEERKQISEYFSLKLAREKEERQAAEIARQEEARRTAELQAGREREAFLDRYIANRARANEPTTRTVAVVAMDSSTKRAEHGLQAILVSTFQPKGITIHDDLFTDAFVADGFFQKLFIGTREVAEQLELARFVDWVLVCVVDVSFSGHPELQNMESAKVEARVALVEARTGNVRDAFSITQAGAGFSKPDAQNAAYERVAGAIGEQLKLETVLEGDKP